MSRTIVTIVLFLSYCVGCDGSAPTGSSSVSGASLPGVAATAAPTASEIAPRTTTVTSASEPSAPPCSPPIKVAPRTLAVAWPQYVGRRVLLSCRSVRRIDFTRTLVAAEGAPFVVTGSPTIEACSAGPRTFTVMGATTVPLGGRTAFAELLVDEDGACAR